MPLDQDYAVLLRGDVRQVAKSAYGIRDAAALLRAEPWRVKSIVAQVMRDHAALHRDNLPAFKTFARWVLKDYYERAGLGHLIPAASPLPQAAPAAEPPYPPEEMRPWHLRKPPPPRNAS